MDIWREGKYLDLWSVTHLISGILLTGWLLLFGLNIWTIFFLHLFAAVLWEIIESLKAIHEHFPNKVTDVIVGNIGLLIAYVFSVGVFGLLILTALYLLLEILGYLAYRKRTRIKSG